MERALELNGSTPRLAFLFRRLRAAFGQWRHNTRTRHLLAQFNERELADAGIDRCQRARELSKPFWR
ncbi:hypothetical protein A9C11_00815 [Pseudomonas citronellolis]|uniref:YjiS-like domain-containing protein n=1 Tax=Pseudomonas citronellolis TaxID=53408 RepID=A0A1A9K4Z1_9PSED|nr:DUF1127 domain-containing protein [Pseudomonas citronellolis]ANI12604.1 hypothetical protein A9C11_00815 [Pseudomonas citronellolis]